MDTVLIAIIISTMMATIIVLLLGAAGICDSSSVSAMLRSILPVIGADMEAPLVALVSVLLLCGLIMSGLLLADVMGSG